MNVQELGKKALQDFADEQVKTIEALNNKVKELEEKNNQLQQLVKVSQESSLMPLTDSFIIPAEEIICLKQLQFLKAKADFDELTYEETKKVEIFSNILTKLRQKGEGSERKLKEVKSEDLLLLINNDDKEQSK